jgi:uncharacterized protein YndB with AHSA1/START domain
VSANGEFFTVGAVRFERHLPGPAARVWDHLTRTDLLPGWFGEGVVEQRPGGAVRLMDGHIKGTVTQCRPPHLLVYTWNVFDPGEEISAYPESYLTLVLDEMDGDVRLTLTHFPIPEPFRKQTAMGWHTFLDMVDAGVRGEAIKPRAEYVAENAKRYDVDLDNLAR